LTLFQFRALVNAGLTFADKLSVWKFGEKRKSSAMNGKTAWTCSARAFEASRNEQFPRLLRQALAQAGVACFWTALALERRALEVWREQRAQRGAVRRSRLAEAWRVSIERARAWQGRGRALAVPAWSLPDSPKMRGLGLGHMWTVLCPFCEEFHTHSPGEGRRTPHCCGERDRQHYVLEFAGALPVEYRTRFYRSSKSGMPRLLHQWPETGVHRSEAVGLLAA
jgi:hypothetical protein